MGEGRWRWRWGPEGQVGSCAWWGPNHGGKCGCRGVKCPEACRAQIQIYPLPSDFKSWGQPAGNLPLLPQKEQLVTLLCKAISIILSDALLAFPLPETLIFPFAKAQTQTYSRSLPRKGLGSQLGAEGVRGGVAEKPEPGSVASGPL